MLTNKITYNFDMFGALMDDIIICNIDGTLVVTVKRSGMFDMETQVM